MAPPLDIKIKSDDSNSVYNHLSQWTNLVEKQNISQLLESQASQLIKEKEAEDIKNERDVKTREVLFEKYQPFLSLKKQRQQIINKWSSAGLLDGLRSPVENNNFTFLLESQARQIINPQTVGVSSRGFGELIQKPKIKETFLSKIKSFFISIWKKLFKKKDEFNLISYDLVSNPGFDTIAFPLVRQVFAQTMALDLVQVQPMNLPKGLLFYMDAPEREDVFSRIVIFEKYKEPTYSRYATQSIGRNNRYYAGVDVANDVTTDLTITFPLDIIID